MAPPLPDATIRTQVTVPLRFADGYATTAPVFTFDGLVDGREHLALGLGDARRPAPTALPAGPAAQRVPDRRRVRQPALRLRAAAARGGRADRRRRRLPALPAPGGPRHRPVRQARRLRAAGRRAWTPTRRTSPSATARTSGTTRPPRRCCARSGVDALALLSNNPDKAAQLTGLGLTVAARVATGVHLSAANVSYLAAKARHGHDGLHRAAPLASLLSPATGGDRLDA